ncbi:N-methylhydantoinase A [Actinomadura pelletieri DSM 43383]|uniref:N-methylhydantoinase A n=1 Tax=Actinomadura pelletieri DSM 43383 TaxID=1120940 RepID=A0A495QKP5_9ACTN|nr:hydantoinase/oxoprolinase family protein [Actinomadura pelletieri]RKS73150.1 N-methylhydantoinase A [Actinomadura pelletieri DSM 43383]
MRVATDIGGTFTDLAYLDDGGRLRVAKSPSTPGGFDRGVGDVLTLAGIDGGVETFVHGTTVVINALLERRGATVALLTTKGFRDVLDIGRASRPDLYNFRYRAPEPFVPRHLRFEIDERRDATGAEVRPLAENDVRAAVEAARAAGATALAVAFLHSYADPAHEVRCGELIAELWPEAFVTLSHEVTREWREYERSNTAVFNAYVQETASTYLDRLEARLGKHGITGNSRVMRSNGGAMTFARAQHLPITLVESGPAAGVIAAAAVGTAMGATDVITLDIGGTTAKTSLIEGGEVRVTTDYRVDWTPGSPGYPIKAPVVDIVEIGAGGGSIAWVDERGRLGLGPRSAGAEPGPACYPNGGAEPTLTDANLVAGRLNPDNFLGGQMRVSVERARAALAEVGAALGLDAEATALGVIRLANAKMLNAIKLVSVRRGHDPRDFSLMAFGGGGAVHALALGAELKAKNVVIPRMPANFSAVGMLMTRLKSDWVRTRVLPVAAPSDPEWTSVWESLKRQAAGYFAAESVDAGALTFTGSVDARYLGQEHTVTIPVDTAAPIETILGGFHDAHERLYTFRLDVPVQVVNFRLAAAAAEPASAVAWSPDPDASVDAARKGVRRVLFEDGGALDCPYYDRELLPVGAALSGPSIIEESGTSTVVHPGQTAVVDDQGNLVVALSARPDERSGA